MKDDEREFGLPIEGKRRYMCVISQFKTLTAIIMCLYKSQTDLSIPKSTGVEIVVGLGV